MQAIALALLFVAADPVTLRLDWEGGDLSSTSPLAAEVLQDATAGSGEMTSETPEPASVCQCGCGKVGCTCPSPGAVVAPLPETATAPSSESRDERYKDYPRTCIIKFTAYWCGPCHAERISDWARQSKWEVKEFNVDPELKGHIPMWVSEKYEISSVPTFVVIRGGREVARYTGISCNEFLPILREASK